ncbi:pentatricopeptide repeat-containing protein [Tanacetum coccineum]
MWRSRLLSATRLQSSHSNTIRSISKSHHNKVLNHQTPLASNPHLHLFKSFSFRLFSSSVTDSVSEGDVIIEKNDGGFSIDEMWKEGVDEVGSALDDVFDIGESNAESVEIRREFGEFSENKESVEEVVVGDEARGVDEDDVNRVIAILKNKDVEFDGSLDEMNLSLSEEFVIRVLESGDVSGESLVGFLKWVYNEKNREVFSVTSMCLDVLVKAVCRELKKTGAYKLWDLVKEIGEKGDGVVTTKMLNALISLFSRLGKGMAGYEVFSRFEDLSCVTNADTYYYTIEALCRRSIHDRVGLVCEKMLSEEKLPEGGKVGSIIGFLCKGGMVKEAHSVYMSAQEKKICPPQAAVNFLITTLCDRKKNDVDNVGLALKMLDDFTDGEKRKYAIKQYTCVIQALCRINDIDGAKSLLAKMIDAGPPPGNTVYNTIINGLCKSGDMAEAIKIMKMMEDRGLKPDVFAYTVIMSGYAKGGEMEEAAKILADAKKNHCKLTPVTYHTMIRGYCKLERFGKAVQLLEEMEDYGVQPKADEYNKLIQSLCLKAADWGMAQKLMEEMTKKGLHLNGITKSLIRAVQELEEETKVTKEVNAEA